MKATTIVVALVAAMILAWAFGGLSHMVATTLGWITYEESKVTFGLVMSSAVFLLIVINVCGGLGIYLAFTGYWDDKTMDGRRAKGKNG